MLQLWRQTLVILVLLSVITGIVYPLVLTGIAQLVFPHQANGSLIDRNGQTVGSELIGQPFSAAKYFWTRPSATVSIQDSNKAQPYNAANSGGSNLGPLNPALADNIKKQIEKLHAADPTEHGPVPVDLATSSASGLDPHISPAAAEFQVARVAQARGLSEEKVRQSVADCTEPPQFGLLGEPRVNVLRLNITLDSLR